MTDLTPYEQRIANGFRNRKAAKENKSMTECNHIIGYWDESTDCFTRMVRKDDNDAKYHHQFIDVKFKFCPDCGEKLQERRA